MAQPGLGSVPVSKIELHISCNNLLDKDVTSKSDPCAVLYLQDRGKWYEVGIGLLYSLIGRVAEFKRHRTLGDQKRSEDNQELRPGCPPDYQIVSERIVIPTNLLSSLSLTNKHSSMRTSTTYI